MFMPIKPIEQDQFSKATSQGFTLIEVMVAIGIFALISIAAYQLLTAAMQNSQALEISSEKMAELQRGMLRLEQDIDQFAFRRTRDQFGDVSPLFKGESMLGDSGSYIEFTRSGWRNPAGLPRSDLEHVIYLLDEGTLWRYSWFYLDRDHEEADLKRPLIRGIEQLKFKFLKAESSDLQGGSPASQGSILKSGQWQEQWAVTTFDDGKNIPRAVSVEFDFGEGVKLKRLFRLGVNTQ